MNKYIEREIVEKAKLDIINRMEHLRGEWKRISESEIDIKYSQFYSGRADGIEAGQRIVELVIEDILDCPAIGAKMDGGSDG